MPKVDTAQHDGIPTRDVPTEEVAVGDIVVHTTQFMGRNVTTIATVTAVGGLQEIPGFATFRHFKADMVTGSGHANPDWGFMTRVDEAVRVKA